MKRKSSPVVICLVEGTLAFDSLPSHSTIFGFAFNLSEAEMVQDFHLIEASASRTVPLLSASVGGVQALFDADRQRISLARWSDGTECLLGFDESQPYPNPAQLIRAYKRAFTARALKDIAGGAQDE